MRRGQSNVQLPKLHEAESLQETLQILGARKAPQIYVQLANMAWKIKDETGQIRNNMLKEAEMNLAKDEKQGLIGHQMKEGIHTEEGTEGDARKSGQTAQADGRTLDSVTPPGAGSNDGSKPAQAQSGTSQLSSAIKEAIDQVANMGSVDPMNTAVIDYIDDGMSKVQAHNAASKDNSMMEAVFDKKFKSLMIPILKKVEASFNAYAETVKVVDSKIEAIKPTQEFGLAEAIKEQTIIPTRTTEIDERSIDEVRSEITSKYLGDSIYN